MTRTDALRLILDSIPTDLGVRDLATDHDETDDVTWWTATIFDPYLDEGDDKIGVVSFPEHWPEVSIDWF